MKCILGKKRDMRKAENSKNNILRFIDYTIEKKLRWTELCLATIVMNAAVSVAAVYIPRSLVMIVSTYHDSLWKIVIFTILFQMMYFILKMIASRLREKLRIKSGKLYRQAYEDLGISQSDLSYDEFITSENMELTQGAKYGIWQLPALSASMEKLGSSIAAMTLNGLIIAVYDWKYLLIPVISLLFLKPLYRYVTKIELDNAKRLLPENRAFGWYCKLISDFRYGEDLRVYQGDSLIMKHCSVLMDKIYLTNQKAFAKKGLYLGFVKFLIQFQIVVFSVFIGFRSMQKLSVEDFVLLFSAICAVSTACNEIIVEINMVKKFDALLDSFFSIIEKHCEPSISHTRKLESIHTLEFNDVTFTYPQKTIPALKNVSFSISSGEKVGIVGMNGAGKSTIVKLLCKFYAPQSGQILLDGKDIQEMDADEHQEFIAALFQDYGLLPVTILENIAGKAEEQISPQEKERVKELFSVSNLEAWISMLEAKENTFLTPALSSKYVSPSGGQGQCLAMLRVLFKNSPIYVFDEPTMALDSETEETILQMLMEIGEHNICVMISHRLSHVKLMNRILVLEDGKIVEDGTHASLIRKDGLYKKMYNLQAEKYGVQINGS